MISNSSQPGAGSSPNSGTSSTHASTHASSTTSMTTDTAAPASVSSSGNTPGNTSSTEGKVFVRDLQDKQIFHSVFLARDKSVLSGKNGKPYISLFLADNSGSIDSRIWDNVDQINALFSSGDVIKVKGQVQIFQNRRQAIIHRIEKAESTEFQMADFVSSSRRSGEEMFLELMEFVNRLEDSNIRQLTTEVLNDPEIRPKILVTPAAKTIHHAYVGGLLEHVLSICGMMKGLAAHYRGQGIELKEDLLIFGAIFHDIGKIWELQIENGISYTDQGKLIGHMVMAVELVEKKASRILGFPSELKDLLKHIILSHHGRLEYGSPKTPMFLEAFIVAAIDDLDSKINSIARFIESERATGETWSKFNPMYERYFHLKV